MVAFPTSTFWVRLLFTVCTGEGRNTRDGQLPSISGAACISELQKVPEKNDLGMTKVEKKYDRVLRNQKGWVGM